MASKPAFTFRPLGTSNKYKPPDRTIGWENILQYSAKGKLLRVIGNLTEFVIATPGMSYDAILHTSTENRTQAMSHRGYIWRRQINPNDPIPKRIKPLPKSLAKWGKPITAWSEETGFLYFRTAVAAVEELGLPDSAKSAIASCCSGRQKTAYGYKWKHTLEDRSEFD